MQVCVRACVRVCVCVCVRERERVCFEAFLTFSRLSHSHHCFS